MYTSAVSELISNKTSNERRVFVGDFLELTINFCTKFMPYGKVLIICGEEAFFSHYKLLRSALYKNGVTPLSIILPKDFTMKVDDLCGLFCVGEEIRGVIALGEKAFSVCKYFSAVRNIPFALISLVGMVGGALDGKIAVRNDKTVDIITSRASAHLIIDNNSTQEQNVFNNVVTNLCEKLVFAFDLFFIGKDCIALIKKVLASLSYCAFLYNEERLEKTKLLNLILEVEEEFIKTDESEYLSSVQTSKLILGVEQNQSDNVFFICYYILNKYLTGSKSCDSLEVPDYRTRVDKLTSSYHKAQTVLLKNLLFQADIVSTNTKKFMSRLDGTTGDLIYAFNLVSSIKEKYFSNVSGLTKEQEELVCLSGDTPLSFNGMSLLRELGRI